MIVNGFVFPNIDVNILIDVLPSLTFLSIFSYHINYDGSLTIINDNMLIESSNYYNVSPLMVITNIGIDGRFSSDLANFILNNENIQDILIDNVINILKDKKYKGLIIDFEYVYPEDKDNYINFIKKVKQEINNYLLLVALAPKTSNEQKGLLYEAHDYKAIGEIVDYAILMTYEWGYSGGTPRAVSPINLVENVIKYAIQEIPSNKILMGIPNYGYDWIIPYVPNTLANSVSNYEAVNIAKNYNQIIKFDELSQTPYFRYFDNSNEHEVWFEDARSIQAKLELVNKYNLAGISYWTINRFFPQNYLVLNSMFDIKKI